MSPLDVVAGNAIGAITAIELDREAGRPAELRPGACGDIVAEAPTQNDETLAVSRALDRGLSCGDDDGARWVLVVDDYLFVSLLEPKNAILRRQDPDVVVVVTSCVDDSCAIGRDRGGPSRAGSAN
jgi:hypothetical protein